MALARDLGVLLTDRDVPFSSSYCEVSVAMRTYFLCVALTPLHQTSTPPLGVVAVLHGRGGEVAHGIFVAIAKVVLLVEADSSRVVG